jgi:glycine/D-amino acid oxidase-like deaminating enzyme
MTDSNESNAIVIVGGGIIGTCCAYFLSTHASYKSSGRRIVLLEATELAGGASGKAGGLLALWAFPVEIVPLSFRLHAELAEKHGGSERWGYRMLDGCWSVEGKPRDKNNQKKQRQTVGQEGIEWLDGLDGLYAEEMAPRGDTAQVHPGLFTKAIAEEASKNGVEIIMGRATEILTRTSGSQKHVVGVKYIPTDTPTTASNDPTSISSSTPNDETTIAASTIILAAGPWTATLYPKVPITAMRAHSIIIKPTEPIPAHAIFTSIALPPNARTNTDTDLPLVTPEIYPRPDGTVYACAGDKTNPPLPSSTAAVAVDDVRADAVWRHVGAAASALRDGEVCVRQACYLPSVGGRREGPIVGETEGTRGLVIAAGHTCWGIQNSAATGLVVSEIVWEGRAKSADVGELHPKWWGL